MTAQPQNPAIELIETADETTLMIDGGQAMQAWECYLMHESAGMLCEFGSDFLEVGLGLGLSALHIAENPRTQRHVVVERYARVIELFEARHPSPPASLEIVEADFVDHVRTLEAGKLDGIFFDPFLPEQVNADVGFWREIVPLMVRALRDGRGLHSVR